LKTKMIIYDYKRKGRKTNSVSEPMKYKMVNKLKEVVNRLIENNFEPIVAYNPGNTRRLSRIKVFAYSPGWDWLIYVRKGKIYLKEWSLVFCTANTKATQETSM